MRTNTKQVLVLVVALALVTLGLCQPANAQLPMGIPDFCLNSTGANLVAAGETVTLSGSQGRGCVAVRGTLVLSGALTADTVMVYEGGFLDIENGASITIRNTPTTDTEQWGTGIIVFGRIRALGAVKTPFVRMAAEPRAGDSSVTLASAPTNWAAGDEVFLPDSRQVPADDRFNANFALRHETRTIAAINGTTVTFTAPLTHDHPGARNANGTPAVVGGIPLLPHLANLTRGITIRSADPNGTRGHLVMTVRAQVELRGVAVRDFGRTQAANLDSAGPAGGGGTNQIGRYPVHIHHLIGPVNPTNTGYQFQLVGNVIRDARKWPIAIHNSSYGLVDGNVIVGGNQLAGAGIALEDGNEIENLIQNNFVGDIRGNVEPRDTAPSTANGRNPGGGGECIWGAGFYNRFVNNVVAGCRNPMQNVVNGVGFKFVTNAAPATMTNPTARGESTTISVVPQHQPILQFDGNEAYGLMADGLTIWQLGTDGYSLNNFSQAESTLRNLRVWNAAEGAVWLYPTNRLTIDGLVYRYDPSVTSSHPIAVTSGDYRTVNLTIRGGDIHAGSVWAEGIDPIGTFLFENVRATTRNHAFRFRTPATPGTGANHTGHAFTGHVIDPIITAWPGQPLKLLQMDHNLQYSPSDTATSYTAYVTEGSTTTRVCFPVQASENLYGGTCPGASRRPDIDGITLRSEPPPPPSLPRPPDPNQTWTFCANEGGHCPFTGTRTVRYGSGTTFVMRVLTNGTPCTNGIFGDPTPNVVKRCDVGSEPTDPSPTPPGPSPPNPPPSHEGHLPYCSGLNCLPLEGPPMRSEAQAPRTSFSKWTAGDYDGDAKADPTVFDASTGTWHMLTSRSGYVQAAAFSFGGAGDVPVPGDYDGDGRADRALYRALEGTWLVAESRSGFTTVRSYSFGASEEGVPAPADYDGDRLSDAAVFRPSSGTWYIRYSRSGFTDVSAYRWGGEGDLVAPGDFDGDGRTDLTVYRPSTRTWHVLTSTTGFGLALEYRFGDEGDVPVPADYDGDGRSDLATYSPVSGVWRVLTSNSSFTQALAQTLGGAGNMPAPADYDGDGKADFAVYRPATGGWILNVHPYALIMPARSSSIR